MSISAGGNNHKQPNTVRHIQLEKRKNQISKEFTHNWALANYFATHDITRQYQHQTDPHVEDQGHDTHQDQAEVEPVQYSDDTCLSLKERTPKHDRLAKGEVLPTWAATTSVLLSCSSESHCQIYTEVIAPLFKTSPTEYKTLHTVVGNPSLCGLWLVLNEELS